MKLCEALGHYVEESPLPLSGELVEEAFFVVYSAGTAAMVDGWARELDRAPRPGELEPYTEALAARGRAFTASELLLALNTLQAATRAVAAFHESVDLFVTPTLAEPPVLLSELVAPADDPLELLRIDAEFAPFTWLANGTGQPAMSVPLHWTADNLPVGVHFTAAQNREDLLFRMAGQLESARPWATRHPPPPS